MKLAFTAKENNTNSILESNFERSKYFIIINTLKPEEIEILSNPNCRAIDCEGVLSAQFIINKGIDTIVTNYCTDDTLKLFRAAGIKILFESSDYIKNIIRKSKIGNLEKNTPPYILR